jgi:glycosyltransferase involved in cell wall biosynthesis
MRTLLAHEWIAAVGGSENVLEQMRLTLPQSRTVCLWNDNPSRFRDVDETWLARSPLRRNKVAAMPFMESAWKHVDFAGAQRVIASSHAFSHHLASRAAAVGIPAFAYVYSPARYVWVPDVDVRGNSLIGRLGRAYFRRLDSGHVSSNVRYAGISRFVTDRMSDTWGVEASVVYPPVDIERIRDYNPETSYPERSVIDSLPAEFVLGASRLVPYKNLDAAISAGEILGLPVVIAGSGPDESRLRELAQRAKTTVLFAGRVGDDALIELYRRATLYVYMPIEDFGIMPIEAIACGTPVLANEVGGARETVHATGGGVTTGWRQSRFEDPSAVLAAVHTDMSTALSKAEMFSNQSFRKNFLSWLETNSDSR